MHKFIHPVKTYVNLYAFFILITGAIPIKWYIIDMRRMLI